MSLVFCRQMPVTVDRMNSTGRTGRRSPLPAPSARPAFRRFPSAQSRLCFTHTCGPSARFLGCGVPSQDKQAALAGDTEEHEVCRPQWAPQPSNTELGEAEPVPTATGRIQPGAGPRAGPATPSWSGRPRSLCGPGPLGRTFRPVLSQDALCAGAQHAHGGPGRGPGPAPGLGPGGGGSPGPGRPAEQHREPSRAGSGGSRAERPPLSRGLSARPGPARRPLAPPLLPAGVRSCGVRPAGGGRRSSASPCAPSRRRPSLSGREGAAQPPAPGQEPGCCGATNRPRAQASRPGRGPRRLRRQAAPSRVRFPGLRGGRGEGGASRAGATPPTSRPIASLGLRRGGLRARAVIGPGPEGGTRARPIRSPRRRRPCVGVSCGVSASSSQSARRARES